MNRISFVFCLLLLAVPGLFAQRIAPVGAWTGYPSHNYPREMVKVGTTFYVATKGGLCTYDTQSKVSRSYTTIDGMSQVNPSSIYHDPLSGINVLGFSDGMLNFFTNPDEGFKFVSDIQRSELFTTKSVNCFASNGNLLYVGCEFGLVVYDLERLESKATVSKIGSIPTGTAIRDLQIFGDSLVVAMGNYGVWKINLNQNNISSPSNWEEMTGKNGLTTGNCRLLAKSNLADFIQISDTVYRRSGNGSWAPGPFPHRPFTNMTGWGDYFTLTHDKTCEVLSPNGGITFCDMPGKMYSGYADSSLILVGDTVQGLSIYYDRDSFLTVTPPGPYNNLVTRMGVGNQEFYVAPEGKGGSTAPAGNTDGFWHFHPSKGWRRFEVEDELPRDSVWAEFGRALYINEDSVCYLGSWNHGLIRLKSGEITNVWTPKNSMLNGGVGEFVRVSGMAQDKSENLWVTAIVADYNINVLDPEGNWYNYAIPGLYPSDVIIDDWGNKWIINFGQGMTVFNENGTLDVSTDDQVKFLTTEAGRGGLPNGNVYTIAKDLRGQIWVGTLEGVAVFANPSAVFNSNFSDASCPVIDGFCLLRDQSVNTIVVDGANRKWIGTQNGLYLVNPQGNRLIEHYTTDNSPLFSNEIRDLQIDQHTGEIFIGTTMGILSLMGEAIGGKEDSDEMYVYPNPIQPDYDGLIAITCSYKDVEVKITTVSGRLVKSVTALGGQAVWDGTDMAGNKVTPGIYLAMAADKEGQNSGIAKFVILDRQP